MQPASSAHPPSKKMLWAGRIISALVVLFMLLDGGMKIMKMAPSVVATVHLGYPENLVSAIGVILVASTVLYIIPRTCMLGAILLTGYLGGAIASQLRIGEPLFNHILFPVYFGILVWGGLFLRENRLRELILVQR